MDRHSPRHLKDFWSIIIDTGAAVSVCPMTFCEHIAVKTMPEFARRQFVTVTDPLHSRKRTIWSVGSALLGLPDLDENNVTDSPHRETPLPQQTNNNLVQSKNRNNTEPHTCHTDLGAQSA
eukprot:2837326-Amphidinium_carterae.2